MDEISTLIRAGMKNKTLVAAMLAVLSFSFLHIMITIMEGNATDRPSGASTNDVTQLRAGSSSSSQSSTPGTVWKMNRPVMHTFYEPLDRELDATSEAWRVTHEAEDALVDAWKTAWYAVGFEPVVLTVEDAKRHPAFDDVDVLLKDKVNNYNAVCFFRWLAMATSGGGWMVDYDTFPLDFPHELGHVLVNEGRFTSFESVVPSMLSGSAMEWERVALLLINNVMGYDKDFVSDMTMFEDLKNQGVHDIIFYPPGKFVRAGFDYREPRKVNCDKLRNIMAVHLSHAKVHQSVDEGLFPIPSVSDVQDANNRRSEAGKIYLEDWRSQCMQQS